MITGAPPRSAAAKHRAALELARRRTALQVDTLAHAVVDLDDTVGWARLTELGTRSVTVAQESAVAATTDLLNATLNAVDLAGDVASLPGIQPGRLGSGRDVRGMFAVTRDIVTARVDGGATFPEALDASAAVLTRISAGEPHRIGRDGQLNQGMTDDRFNRYRRVAVGATCKFCLMLATRGAVYLTEQSAGRGRKYHLSCDCVVELVVDQAAIERSKSLSGDWRNAIRDPERLRSADVLRDDMITRKADEIAAAVAEIPVPPAARSITDVITVTRPDAGKIVSLSAERQTLVVDLQRHTDRIVEARAKQAARKAELAQYPGMSPEEMKALIRRDYQIRSQQRIINNALKWDRHLTDKIGVLDKQIADLDFDFQQSPMATWRVGEPMPVDVAAKGANPQYTTNKKAEINCGRVVQTVEMRRRGVEVVAKPMEKMRGTMFEIIEQAWVDSAGAPRKFRKNMAGYTVLDVIEKTWPVGGRGIVSGTWNRGGSHVWNVEKMADGTIQFIEGQSGKGGFAPTEYINRMKLSDFGLLRVDDMQPTQRMVDVMEAMTP
jgi:hypothetical protein